MAPILKLENLEAIDFNLFEMSPDERITIFKKLGGLPELEEVSVGWRIDDEILRVLSTFPKLRKLNLRRATGYTDEGLVKLMTMSPTLQEIAVRMPHE